MGGLIFGFFAFVVLVGALVLARVGSGLSRKTRLQLVASALLVVPIVLLMILAVGEMVGGDVSGAQHVVMAIPLILLLAGAWRYPRATAIVLVFFGLVMLLMWSLAAATTDIRHDEIWVFILMILLISGTPLAAAWLLWRASASDGGSSSSGPPRETLMRENQGA